MVLIAYALHARCGCEKSRNANEIAPIAKHAIQIMRLRALGVTGSLPAMSRRISSRAVS